MDGKYRIADQFVAEDSQDAFFAMDKGRLFNCATDGVEYSENFTRAKVTETCDLTPPMPEARDIKMKVHPASHWKLVDGQWFFYIDSSGPVMTPFGPMKLSPAAGGGQAIRPKPVDPSQIPHGRVEVDKTEVHLSPVSASEQKVAISNESGGMIFISANAFAIPGLETVLSKKQLAPGEKATLTIRYARPANVTGPALKETVVTVACVPLGGQIPIRVLLDATK